MYIAEWFDNRMEINRQRLEIFNQTCEKYKDKIGFESLEESYEHYEFVKKLKFMACKIRVAKS